MLNIGSIVWGVRDLARGIAFWTAALDYGPREEPDEDWAVLIPRVGSGVQLALKLVTSPSARRHHLDLYAKDQEAEVARLLALGATRVDWRYEPEADYVVLADPDGNRFCVIQKEGQCNAEGRYRKRRAHALACTPMGKKDRNTPRLAYASLRDMPGTRVMFWVVDDCPYCGERHLHIAGHLRMADPGESLGEYPAPCDPSRIYELALSPRPKRKGGKEARRKARRDSKEEVLDDDKW